MKGRRIKLIFIILVLILFINKSIQAAPKAQFSILYTNDVMGEVEPCG